MLIDVEKITSKEISIRTREKDLPEKEVMPKLCASQENERNGIKYIKYDFTFEKNRLVRKILTDDRVLFIEDEFFFKSPKSVYMPFVFNKDEDFWCNVADKTRLVIRNKNEGIKFFRTLSMTDGEDTLAKCGLLLPDKCNESGKICITPYSGLYSFGKIQKTHYILIFAPSEDIGMWHIVKEDNSYKITNPKGECKYRINYNEDNVEVSK